MEEVTVIGLGIIGSGLARNLIRAGHRVTVWNRTSSSIHDDLQAARQAQTIREAVQGKQRVLVCVTGPDAQREIYWGEEGLLAAVASQAIVADATTTDPSLSREIGSALSEIGAFGLDTPVFGSRTEAWEGRLDFVCGGPNEAFLAFEPILRPLAASVHYMGDHGAGAAMKLVGNLLVAAQMASLGEALSISQKAGLQSDAVMRVLDVTDYSSALIRGVGRASLARDFTPNFYLKHMLKDARLIRDFAQDKGVPLPVSSAIEALYQAASNFGLGDLNASGLHQMMFSMSGLDSNQG
jgi:3-hydroxyisobutyrate dehydrogenase-like beta-hydroxyacid dehydrogenase